MIPTMPLNEKDAQRILHWQEVASRVAGMDGEDVSLVARIRAAFPRVVKLEEAIKARERRTEEAEQDPRVKEVRDRLYHLALNSPEYDQLLNELIRVRQAVVMELEAKEEGAEPR